MIKKYKYFFLLAIIFLILRLPTLFEPNWYGDEGIYLVLGQAIRKGLTLYSQIHDNKPPTLYYLAALGQTVFGFRLLLLLWMIPTVYSFYLLAKKNKLATLIFVTLSSIPLIEGNIANAEVFMLLPTILGIYLFLFKNKFFLPGLLLGFAFTIKVPVAIEFVFIFAYSFFYFTRNRWLNLIKLAFGFILPITLYLIYFYFKGASAEFLFAALFQNFGYLSSWAVGTHSGSATSGGLIIRGIIMGFSWIGIYIYSRLYPKKIHFVFILGWFSATLFGVLLSTRPYPHYLIQLLPPLILTIFSFKQSKVLVTIPIIFLVFSVIHYKFYFYPVLAYYQNFYLQGNQSRFFSSNLGNTQEISDYIKLNTNPSDHIFVWGDQPFVYVLSDRLPVGRFTVAYHIADFDQYDYIMGQLKIRPPKFIVYYQMPGRPFPQLDSFLNNYYLPVVQSGLGIIYSLRQ